MAESEMAGREKQEKSSPPPFTADTVFNVIKSVSRKNWKNLSKFLIGEADMENIRLQYKTLEDRLRAIAEAHVKQKQDYDFLPWRYLIYHLYMAGELEIADSALKYAEPLQVNEHSQQHFDEAMEFGYAEVSNRNMTMYGPPGSGKSHSLSALLGEDPPSMRVSTACAERAVRTMAHYKVGVKGASLVRVSTGELCDMLTATAEDFVKRKCDPSTQTKEQESLQNQPVAEPKEESPKKPAKQPTSVVKRPASPNESHPCHLGREFVEEILRRMQATSKKSKKLYDSDFLNVTDSGGQPQFHEVLPIFVHDTELGTFVMKLNERLEDHPMVEFYGHDGKPVGEPFRSPASQAAILKHCVRVLLSQTSSSRKPKLMFVGTHEDLEHTCKETRVEKNSALLKMLHGLEENIIFCNESMKEVIFGINAKSVEAKNSDMIVKMRKVIMEETKVTPKKVPLPWFGLEIALQRLVQEKKQGVLSKEQCFVESRMFRLSTESFESALKYLHSLKLLLYYEDVLPEVVFADPQAILDKITELVEHNIRLMMNPGDDPATGIWKKFVQKGILTEEILTKFPSHYIPGTFVPADLLKVFLYLYIIAEISPTEYLMPCLLPFEEVKISVAPDRVIPPLLFYFGEDGPKLGVYCLMIANLLSEAKWKLLLDEDGSVTHVSRNRIQFAVPGDFPGKITITDPFSSFFHVDLQLPKDVAVESSSEICPDVRNAVFMGIYKASQKLNYSDSVPEIGFLCSKHEKPSSDDAGLKLSPHVATVSKNGKFLTCSSMTSSVFERLTEDHKKWLTGYNVCKKAFLSPDSLLSSSVSDFHRLRSKTHYHQIFSFLSSHAYLWRSIGLELGFLPSELNNIESNPILLTQNPPTSYLGKMVELWLEWAPGDRRGSKNFATFDDLRAALLRVDGIAAKAHDLEHALIGHGQAKTPVSESSSSSHESSSLSKGQPSKFDPTMSIEEFREYLTSRKVIMKDITTLEGNGVSAEVFQMMEQEDLKEIHLTVGGRIMLKKLLTEITTSK